MTLQTGQVLNNRYRIVRLLGQGGFGAVYRAWDLNMGIPCAVKENLYTSPESTEQFKREASILHTLRHPNLPLVSDHFSLPGQGQYLVMDYVEGETLQEKLNQARESLAEILVIPWIEQVCDALTYLHSQEPPVIHRDIKPANIKITSAGKAMLVDFGLAKLFHPGLPTVKGAQAITPGYSPPEQYGRGKTDVRSDIYALGATLYALLTGTEPVESIDRLLSDTLPGPETRNPLISPHVAAAIREAMQVNPARRYQNAALFKAGLRGSTLVLPPMPLPEYSTAPSAPSPAIQKKPIPKPACLALVGFLIILGLVSITLTIRLGKPLLESFQDDGTVEKTQETVSTATLPATRAESPVNILFQDNFSDTASGWDRVQDAGYVTDYHYGAYRIFVNKQNTDVWANPGFTFTDIVIEVEATRVAGPEDNDFGVICRYQDVDNYYLFIVSSDGFYAIARKWNGSQELLDMETMAFSDRINQGYATNLIRAECLGDRLVLSINGHTLADTSDSEFTAGDVGLFAGTYDLPGTEIHFDNFLVTSP